MSEKVCADGVLSFLWGDFSGSKIEHVQKDNERQK